MVCIPLILLKKTVKTGGSLIYVYYINYLL